MSSYVSPYLSRAVTRICEVEATRQRLRTQLCLDNGIILNPADNGRTVCDPMPVPVPSPPHRVAVSKSQLPPIQEILSIAIAGGILVILILRGVIGHF